MASLARSSSAFAGQDHDVGALAAAQPIQQRQRRREIGIDARAAFRLITCGEMADRAFQGQRREHANHIFHRGYARRISFSTAVNRRLRLPASAVASSSALCVVAGAGKADADLMAAEDRMLALGRRVLLVEDFALPAAVRRGIGAEIVEERIAAEDAAVMQQHHAGQAAIDAVEHPDVNGIEPVDDAALADRFDRRNDLVVDRRHDRAEHRARHLRRAAHETDRCRLPRCRERRSWRCRSPAATGSWGRRCGGGW